MAYKNINDVIDAVFQSRDFKAQLLDEAYWKYQGLIFTFLAYPINIQLKMAHFSFYFALKKSNDF